MTTAIGDNTPPQEVALPSGGPLSVDQRRAAHLRFVIDIAISIIVFIGNAYYSDQCAGIITISLISARTLADIYAKGGLKGFVLGTKDGTVDKVERIMTHLFFFAGLAIGSLQIAGQLQSAHLSIILFAISLSTEIVNHVAKGDDNLT